MNACIVVSLSLSGVDGLAHCLLARLFVYFVLVCVILLIFISTFISYNCLNYQKLSFTIGLDWLGS